MDLKDWAEIHRHILELEAKGLASRTFRRLDPTRQEQVLNAILEEAIEHGPSAANVKRIAARADISVGSLYNYFQDRDSLLGFAVELCTRYMIDSLEAFQPYLLSLPLKDALEAYILGGLQWSQTQMSLVRFFLRAAYGGEPELQATLVEPVAHAMLDLVSALLSKAQEQGELRLDLDLPALSRVLHAWTLAVGDSQLLPPLNGYLQVTGRALPLKRALQAMLDVLLNGIGAAPDKHIRVEESQ